MVEVKDLWLHMHTVTMAEVRIVRWVFLRPYLSEVCGGPLEDDRDLPWKL